MSKQDAERQVQARDRWILVIVGGYMHEALVLLGQKDPQRWAGFKWRLKEIGW